ncbi:hypothetical protein GH714_000404 [Hevea brasiliensis]|uniref:Hexosyltransferase n=1 Tax=Hevea brasiliensis TaxID=3981 RepID=A0A6A6LAE7_HEVBR|nr:hypothetical protein GH714_000404 [Hevea brasiliensis]
MYIEETSRRKSFRDKGLRDVEKALQVPIQYRNLNCKITTLKIVLVIIALGTLITFFHSPAVHIADHPSTSGSRPSLVDLWIGEDAASDPRYISTADIDWDQISDFIDRLNDSAEYQGIGLLNFNMKKKNLRFPLPSVPKLKVPGKPRIDVIAVKLPCDKSGRWSRDVARLHLQLAAASLAASAKSYHPVHVLLVTDCFPTPNLFTCKELIFHEGNLWLYQPNLNVLREKLQLPVGHVNLQFLSRLKSIRMAGSTRDLVILVDETISDYHRGGLEAAGWKIHTIQRIRNPKAEKDAYNEWNYSKFRLWQLTDYDKIIFIDADMLILRNIDLLFEMPEITAIGNNATLFNSGVMVVEPSNCTFQLLMDHINEIESYNGGDQEFASDVAHKTWWKVHDAMPENLHKYCLLRSKQKAALEWDRRQAEKANYTDGHWKIKIKDKRLKTCFEDFCFWESMLWHWGEKNWTDNATSVAPSPPPPVAITALSL